jgi:hypothetical protein
MTLLIGWVVFPLVLGALCLGAGLFVEWVAGVAFDPTLLLPVGLATLIVVAGLATAASSTAPIATPCVVAVAVGGIAARPPVRRRISAFAAVSTAGVFALFAAPIVLSGNATVAGWIKLDDTATWLAITDRVMKYGRSVAGLPPSTYEATLSHNLSGGYPIGTFLPFGAGGQLVREDLAWLFQPYEAFLAAMLVLAVFSLVGAALRNRLLCAVVAFLAAQSALYYGYALWGGVKEVAAAPLLAVAAASVRPLRAPDSGVRDVIPLAVTTAATLGALSVGGLVWLLPIVGAAAVVSLRRRPWRFGVRVSVAFATTVLVLSTPTIAISHAFYDASGPITQTGDLGNLIRPLRFAQVIGIWPVGDFRVAPDHVRQTYVLIAIAALAAALGLFCAIRRGALELALYIAASLFGAILLTLAASPWVAAKALATASPALIAAAVTGAAFLIEGRKRIEGLVVLAAIGGGVIWSNALQYHDVSLAPHDQLAELSTIGSRFAGDGPALMMEYSPYGARHFLRRLDPESAGELRTRLIPLRNRTEVPKGGYADIDAVQLSSVLVYRTLVLNRSPIASRPPSVYHLVWHGRFYDVWQRPETATRPIIEHLPLGNGDQAGAIPSCPEVMRLAGQAQREGAVLATVQRSPAVVVPLSQTHVPPSWGVYPESPDVVYPTGAGTLQARVVVPSTGLYDLWLGGSFRRHLDVLVDGHLTWQGRHELNHPGVFTPTGSLRLTAGTHDILLRYSAANLWPGSGGSSAAFGGLGPLILARRALPPTVTLVAPARAHSLCGKTLDWIEILDPTSQ